MGGDADQIANEALRDTTVPVALVGLEGVWCWTTNVAGKLVLANIVRSG